MKWSGVDGVKPRHPFDVFNVDVVAGVQQRIVGVFLFTAILYYQETALIV